MTDMITHTDQTAPSNSQPTSSTYPAQPGRLVGAVTLTLHTRQGTSVLLGRPEPVEQAIDNDQASEPPQKARSRQIFGINTFSRAIDRIMAAKNLDDIYAVQMLTELDHLLTNAEALLTNERQWLAKKMNANSRLTVQVAQSVDPQTFELDLSSSYAHWAARLIGTYDELVAAALSANRASIITDAERQALLNHPRAAIRATFYKAVAFKVTGITRDDVDQANARAADAVAEFGEISKAILSGRKQPNYLH